MDSLIDKARKVREGEGLDLGVLGGYLSEHAPEVGEIVEVLQFPGGYSNLTYLLKGKDGGEYVLRRPPFGAKIKSAHDMGREFRVLSALKPIYAKVPKPIVHCEDEEVLGAPFYVMERVKGVILRQRVPKGIEMTTELMRSISEAVIDNLVDLHALDVYKHDLVGMGKPEGYVERQVEGWIRRYYKAQTDDIKAMDMLAEWMRANRPADIQPSMIHNDYKYDNVVLNPSNLGEIMAVLDWEMATVGDPLMDFGTTLAYWAEEKDHPFLKGFSLASFKGNLTREEVVVRYAERSGRDVSNILFYFAYACFKIGVIGQQIYARYKKGYSKDPRFGGLIHLVKACAQTGSLAVKKGRISRVFE